jgi:hypothetical protein
VLADASAGEDRMPARPAAASNPAAAREDLRIFIVRFLLQI